MHACKSFIQQIAFFLILLFITQSLSAQEIKLPKASKKTFTDCDSAVKITLNKRFVYGPTKPPDGPGKLIEISGNKKNSFEKEHHSAWYNFSIKNEGKVTFEIIPVDSTNDYDFMLFAFSVKDSNACRQIAKGKANPVRSNIARNDAKHHGRTGLHSMATQDFVSKGPGNNYSNPVDVKKGERYILVVDNVYDNGQGHTLKINYIKDVEINGIVLNEDKKPMEAEVSISDGEGNEIINTKSDKNGEYSLKTILNESEDYNLTIYNDSTFINTKVIRANDFMNNKGTQKLSSVLPRLRKGKKYVLGNINFYGGMDVYIPAAKSSLQALYKLMKHNQKLSIMIEGHVNESGRCEGNEYTMKLSLDRALAVRKYLIEKGIDENRIQFSGKGCTERLYPDPKNEKEMELNRRVEIKVLQY